MRVLIYLVKTLAMGIFWLVLFFSISAVIALQFQPPFTLLAEDDLPNDYPLAITWMDTQGARQCRAIWKGQLEKARQSVPTLTLSLDPEVIAVCEQSTLYLKRERRWPAMFKWDRTIHWPYATIKLEADKVFVAYSHDDDIVNQSRYRVLDGLPSDAEHLNFFGPRLAFMAMPYGLGITAVLWIANRLYWRRRRKRRELEDAVES